MDLKRLSILGVGLLGGSIGLAARSKLSDCHIVGYGHRRETLTRAQEIGAIHEAADNLGDAVKDADLIVLCTPVLLFGEVLKGIAGSLKPEAIVTDVGSTKRSVVELAGRLLPAHASFVGSHPMAGSEKRGVEFARTDLFENALCILTPTDSSDAQAVTAVEEFWRLLGMRTCRMTPADHDAALADVSHLPHAVAAALVNMQRPEAMRLSGKGFLDATRIAGGDGGLWRDIFLDNADNVRASIARLRRALDEFEGLIRARDGEKLRAWLDAAAARREELVRERLRDEA
ncbi:MAG TPA: prephenate dehydrogenase [Tepidisphaeraceae bacterium]|nr:prephenate dehydrogenase [Tepidisphaeraceae bacterium]